VTPEAPAPLGPGDPRLSGWYHTIELAPGVVTEGAYDHRPVVDHYGIPESLEGLRALDVGTSNGFFAFELERRGADVTALDIERWEQIDWFSRGPRMTGPLEFREQFFAAHSALGSSVTPVAGSVYELSPEWLGTFDLVFCGSLLLHLHSPLLALQRIRSVTNGLAIVETGLDVALEASNPGEPLLRFGSREHEELHGLPLGSAFTYWRMTRAALAELMAHAGFDDLEVLPSFELPPIGHTAAVVHGRAQSSSPST
jgi:tRNA (mo5U34)-methyltransferase